MTAVYVDLDLLWAGSATEGVVDQDALRSLGHLAEAGHEVLLVGTPGSVPVAPGVGAHRVVPEAPRRPEASAWYLTAEVERCRGSSSRLRTVLIGAPPASASIHRCDTLARDVRAGILEILAAEAMTPA